MEQAIVAEEMALGNVPGAVNSLALGLLGPTLIAHGSEDQKQRYVKRMLTAEGDKTRYQQAMHFVTHEMRTPLTAIQGSSELIGRYAMSEEKRKQMAQLINSESKRLARLVDNLLVLARVERRVELAGAEPVLIRPLVTRAIEGERRACPEADLGAARAREPLAVGAHSQLGRRRRVVAVFDVRLRLVALQPGGDPAREPVHIHLGTEQEPERRPATPDRKKSENNQDKERKQNYYSMDRQHIQLAKRSTNELNCSKSEPRFATQQCADEANINSSAHFAVSVNSQDFEHSYESTRSLHA